MKAVRIHSHGGTEVLLWEDIDKPSCPDDKVRVKIKAAALNHLDIWVRNGFPGMPLPLPLIMGSDGSGIITEVGKAVENWTVGDEIVVQPNVFCGSCDECNQGRENHCINYGIIGETTDGTMAEEIIFNQQNIHAKPDHLSFAESASMQLVFLTSYQMISQRAKLKSGENLLVYGATSGVGSAAIQIGKYFGATVHTTVGAKEKFPHAEKMGADYIYNHSNPDWFREARFNTGKDGMAVIFEHVGPATWPASLRLLGRGGRLVTCGATTGPKVEIDLRHLFMKQQTILGSTMSDIKNFEQVMDLINQKVFFPFIDQQFVMSDVIPAQERLEDRNQYGKIVLVND